MTVISTATSSQELAQVRASIKAGRIAENSTKDDSTRKDILRINGGRGATAEVGFQVTGTGQIRIKKVVTFPVIFRTEPQYTLGYSVVKNPDPDNWHDPIGSAGVYAWQRNKRGRYLGAFIYVRVDAYPTSGTGITYWEYDDIDPSLGGSDLPPLNMKTQIYLTFSARGVKDVDLTGVNLNATRMPGIK